MAGWHDDANEVREPWERATTRVARTTGLGIGWVILILALVVLWVVLGFGDGQAAAAPVYYQPGFVWVDIGQAIVAWEQPPAGAMEAVGSVYIGTLGVYKFVPQAELVFMGRIGEVYYWQAKWRPVTGVEGIEVNAAIQVGWDVYWTVEPWRVWMWTMYFPGMVRDE